MKKRILAALLATIILLTLAGCANNKADAPAPDTIRPTATATAETTGTAESDMDTEHTEEKKNSTAEETKLAETTETQEPSESVTEPTETVPADTKPQTTKKPESESKPAETVPKETEQKPTETKPAETKPPQTETTTTPKEEITEPPVQVTDEPKITEQPVTSEPPKQTTEEPRGTEPPETTAPITEPVPESIYDAPFDIEQIRAELIAVGESMGMRHRTAYKDGTVITPDNSSWELPITANASFSGAVLKRSLYDYVSSYDEYELYGGEPITDFTIYVKQTADGYEFYFLH